MDKDIFPQAYEPGSVEKKWAGAWERDSLYRYDPAAPRENTFVVDTPPPTVSGALHVGHVFSYAQTDIIVRYQRMRGKNVFYPMGWDDNGLPTERRVQNLFGIRCEPGLPYRPGWRPQPASGKTRDYEHVSRGNFLETCALQTGEDEKKYEALWRRLGLSIDWSRQYSTVGESCRRISQLSFLDLYKKGMIYSAEAPTLWDTGFRTAIAQAEVEDRETAGNFYDVRFRTEDGEDFVISTTRPELLAACVAVVAHPDDARFSRLFGRSALTPLFSVKVPIMPSTHTDPEKGTGIMMVCTFGDMADVEFWRKEKLPLRQIIGRDGRLLPLNFNEPPFGSRAPGQAQAAYRQLEGLYARQARTKTAELLAAAGALAGNPRPVTQAVKFYEKGDLPLEFVSARQWFVRILENKAALLEQGRSIRWHPPYMFKRYEQWVEGLNQDWCISRQRYFGVPFPVWYPVGGDGRPDFTKPILAEAARLPVDPQTDCPPGFAESRRGAPGGFVGDSDVMDTWATSSLTPFISSRWLLDPERHEKLFPADLRPQSHEIIRTWAFYTITKAWMHENRAPWKHIAISGWVVDPDRQKMSKSKGKTVTPEALLETYSADALRYWAARAKLGQDTVYDESVFKVGMRLAVKIFNASRFTMIQLGQAAAGGEKWDISDIREPIDRSLVGRMRALIESSTADFENYEYAAVLLRLETGFWDFCDNYLELVKNRAYNGKTPQTRKSAVATLEWTLGAYLRLFAPFLPYVTEEVWSRHFAEKENHSSVHRAPWPSVAEVALVPEESAGVLDAATAVISRVRGEKAAHKKSVKWPVKQMIIEGAAEDMEAVGRVMDDLVSAANIPRTAVQLKTHPDADDAVMTVSVELGETEL